MTNYFFIKIFVLIIFLKYSYCAILNNVFQIDNLSPKVTEKYPDQTYNNYCSFKFDIMASCLVDGFGYPIINYTTSASSYTIYPMTTIKNETSAIYLIWYNSVITENPVNVNIELNGCGYGFNNTIYSFPVHCHGINAKELNITNSDIKTSILFGEYSLVKIKGGKYPLNPTNCESFNADYCLRRLYSCNYRSNYTGDDVIAKNCTFSIDFYNQTSLNFSASPSYLNSKINIISDIKTYPNFTNNVYYDQIGNNYFPSLTFKLKSDVQNPFISSTYNYGYSGSFYPIYGDSDGTMTYIKNIYYGVQNTSIFTNLYYQKDIYAEKVFNFSFIINEYKLNVTSFYFDIKEIEENLFLLTTFSNGSSFNIAPFSYQNSAGNTYDYATYYSFPFGFTKGNLLNFEFENSLFTIPPYYFVSICQTAIGCSTSSRSFSNYTDKSPPIVHNVQVVYIGGTYNVLRIHASDPSGISLLYIDNLYGLGIKAITILTSGSIYDGVFEVVVSPPKFSLGYFYISDTYGNYADVLKSEYYNINPPRYFTGYNQQDSESFLKSLKSLYFEYDVMDVSNSNAYNILYLNFSKKIDIPCFLFLPSIGQKYHSKLDLLEPKWDDGKQLYILPFEVKKNSMSGPLEFIIVSYPDVGVYFQDIFTEEFNLKTPRVISKTVDLAGPIISDITKIPGDHSFVYTGQEVGWNIVIEDTANGFSFGYVVVNGLVDGSRYNFTLQGNGERSISFKILLSNISCVTQTFRINEIVLFDTSDRMSYFQIATPPVYISLITINMNPLMYYLDNQDVIKINVTCIPTIDDQTPPDLLSITTNVTTIDMGSNNRSISFEVVVSDLESGINKGQSPTVYLSSLISENVECKTKLKDCQSNNQCTFYCEIELPYAFAYPYPIIYQVYGIMNGVGLFSGFSYNKLVSLNYQTNISTTFTKEVPVITSTSEITNLGGELLIIGAVLNNISKIYIQYKDKFSTLVVNCNDTLYCLINVDATISPFTVQLETNDKKLSNKYMVNPRISFINQTSSSSQEQPTCLGNPICGGPLNGFCSSKGCVCFEPWTGPQCLQKIIIVPQPSFNGTDPNITIVIPDDNDNEKNQYVSLTSIVALRELDINRNAINTIYFDKWINNEINSTFNQYYSNLTNINNGNKTTQTIVNIQWFTNQTNITFAGNHLSMNPYSIKYTIEIVDYPFQNQLNHLEIVMSTMFKSNDNNDNICSNQEFGDTNGYDQSNYLKIQVNDHSLYARFIKRGIIDTNNIVTVSNTILDKSFDSIETPKEIQSFIGISIPHFKKSALIDPDFSVLIDNSPSSYDNCNKSKLSKIQIAGIIIGCVGFASVVAISSIVYYIKTREVNKEMSNLSRKLKKLS